MTDDKQLEVGMSDGKLVISIGIDLLLFAIGHQEQFANTLDSCGCQITNAEQLAKAIVEELEREQEDGTTVVHEMLDNAAMSALENGADCFIDVAKSKKVNQNDRPTKV
jgi:RNA 3'-terminal phosphate cyclase